MKLTIDWDDAERAAIGQAVQNEVESAQEEAGVGDASDREYAVVVESAQAKLFAAYAEAMVEDKCTGYGGSHGGHILHTEPCPVHPPTDNPRA